MLTILADNYDDKATSAADTTIPDTSNADSGVYDEFGAAPLDSVQTTYTLEDEVRAYLREPLYRPTGGSPSPLPWWKVNASRFPRLARFARDVLAIPG